MANTAQALAAHQHRRLAPIRVAKSLPRCALKVKARPDNAAYVSEPHFHTTASCNPPPLHTARARTCGSAAMSAFKLQPVVNVGLQILITIALGWLLVALRVVDGDRYMPQVRGGGRSHAKAGCRPPPKTAQRSLATPPHGLRDRDH